MKKRMAKKLSLTRETLTILEHGVLAEAAGGSLYTSECVSMCIVCPEEDITLYC